MNRNTVSSQVLVNLIGEEAFAKLQAEFGGSQLYIPFALTEAAATPANASPIPVSVIAQLRTGIESDFADRMCRLMGDALVRTPEASLECLAKARQLIE